MTNDEAQKRIKEYVDGHNAGRAKALKDVLKIIENWDVQPCCHGIMQDELIKELRQKLEENNE
jgi:predicted house-cleaning noncanonical NTP pyrophosphatase (MazG superfamily)